MINHDISAPKLRDFGLLGTHPWKRPHHLHHGTVDDLCKFGIQWHLKQVDTNKEHVCASEQQQVLFWFWENNSWFANKLGRLTP